MKGGFFKAVFAFVDFTGALGYFSLVHGGAGSGVRTASRAVFAPARRGRKFSPVSDAPPSLRIFPASDAFCLNFTRKSRDLC